MAPVSQQTVCRGKFALHFRHSRAVTDLAAVMMKRVKRPRAIFGRRGPAARRALQSQGHTGALHCDVGDECDPPGQGVEKYAAAKQQRDPLQVWQEHACPICHYSGTLVSHAHKQKLTKHPIRRTDSIELAVGHEIEGKEVSFLLRIGEHLVVTQENPQGQGLSRFLLFQRWFDALLVSKGVLHE